MITALQLGSFTGYDAKDLRLTFNLFKLNLQDKYIASLLGGVWAVLNPLIMLGLFTFVFGFVYKSKLPGSNSTLDYVVWLISGYGPWLAISEALCVGAVSVVSGTGLVKNLAFKTEILPVASILTSIVPLLISLAFIFILLPFSTIGFSFKLLLLIPAVALQYLFLIGIGFYLSAITVFVRDVSIVLANILMIILFFSPILYPMNVMPHIIQMVSAANPFYTIAELYRVALFHSPITDALLLQVLYVLLLSLFLCWHGLRFFRRAKGNFTSML